VMYKERMLCFTW